MREWIVLGWIVKYLKVYIDIYYGLVRNGESRVTLKCANILYIYYMSEIVTEYRTYFLNKI